MSTIKYNTELEVCLFYLICFNFITDDGIMDIEDVLNQSNNAEDTKPDIKEEKMDTSSLTEDEKMAVDDIDDNSCTSLAEKLTATKRPRKNTDSGLDMPPAKQWKGLR